MNILFVCSGNTCRSPMAEAIAAHMAKIGGKAHHFSSAGLFAYGGEDMSPNAKYALEELCIGFAPHTSRRLNAAMIDQADLVLCMEPSHVGGVLQIAPQAKNKVFPLTSFCGGSGSIRDPYGQSTAAYVACAQQLSHYIEKALSRL